MGGGSRGTADVVQPRKFRRLARINIIPDIDERMKEIQSDPERYGHFLAIRQAVGEGHDQFVDDMFSSHNGRVLFVSRPSLADVVAINVRTKRIIWRTKVDGNRADHMAISPDGTRLLVSAWLDMDEEESDTFSLGDYGRELRERAAPYFETERQERASARGPTGSPSSARRCPG